MTGRPADPRPVDTDLATLRNPWGLMPDVVTAAADRVEAELARLREGLQRITENAEAWHGPEDSQPDAKHRALCVIAEWGRALLADPPEDGVT